MTEAAHYRTVFTVLQQTMPWQPYMVVIGIVVLGTVIAAVTVIRRKMRLAFVLVVYAFFLLIAAYVFPFSGVRDMYRNAQQAYSEGRYNVVEGTVTNVHEGHKGESFSVNGVQFSYSDYIIVPCFNNTASHGGPIREGMKVRIAYSGNCILKLEVATSR